MRGESFGKPVMPSEGKKPYLYQVAINRLLCPPHPDMVESCQVGAGLPCFFVVKLRNDSQASTGRDALATFDHSDIRGLGTA